MKCCTAIFKGNKNLGYKHILLCRLNIQNSHFVGSQTSFLEAAKSAVMQEQLLAVLQCCRRRFGQCSRFAQRPVYTRHRQRNSSRHNPWRPSEKTQSWEETEWRRASKRSCSHAICLLNAYSMVHHIVLVHFSDFQLSGLWKIKPLQRWGDVH